MEDNRIAIVGYSAILPGGENVFECHETIREGLDHVTELPADRVDVTAYFHPDKTVPDKIYCTRGGFIPAGKGSYNRGKGVWLGKATSRRDWYCSTL